MRTALIALSLTVATLASASSTTDNWLQWADDGRSFEGSGVYEHKDKIGTHAHKGLYKSERLTGPLNIIESKKKGEEGAYITRGEIAVEGACTTSGIQAAMEDIGRIALDSASEIARGTDQHEVPFVGEARSLDTESGSTCKIEFGVKYFVE